MVHLAQRLTFSRELQGMPWEEHQTRKIGICWCNSPVSSDLGLWTSKPEVVPFYFNPILLYTSGITETWDFIVITAIFNKITALQRLL